MVDSTALPDHGSVDVDDEGGARAAAEHLLTLGHREFLVIGVEPPTTAITHDPEGVVSRRLRGYGSALADAGIRLPETSVMVGPARIEGGNAAFRRAWMTDCADRRSP
jgi:LacI family transcriptional regulator